MVFGFYAEILCAVQCAYVPYYDRNISADCQTIKNTFCFLASIHFLTVLVGVTPFSMCLTSRRQHWRGELVQGWSRLISVLYFIELIIWASCTHFVLWMALGRCTMWLNIFCETSYIFYGMVMNAVAGVP